MAHGEAARSPQGPAPRAGSTRASAACVPSSVGGQLPQRGRARAGRSDPLPHTELPQGHSQSQAGAARSSPPLSRGSPGRVATTPPSSRGCGLLRLSICYAECSPNYFLRFVMPYRLDLEPVFQVS